MSRGSDYKPPFCRCQKLEERIEDVYELYDEIRQKVHSLKQEVKTMRENEKNIVDEQIAISRHLNKISPEQSEPDYLQVGDQWRDEEGNEYVLSSCKMKIFHHFGDCAGSDTRFKALLINKETGLTVNATKPEIFLNHGFLENNKITKAQLGITDSMVKIK